MNNTSQPTRIAHMITEMNYGGVEMVVMNYYRHIDRLKFQFDFFVLEGSIVPQRAEIESLGGRIYVVPHYKKLVTYEKVLIKIFKENKYKIVHSHMNTLSVFSLRAAKKAGIPIRIAHNHSTLGKGEYKKNLFKYILRPFAEIYPTDLAACSHLAGDWIYGKNSIYTVFNNAIDLNKYKYDETIRTTIRNELGLKDNIVIGHIGRFCYQKNHDFLIDIFAEVYNINPNARLLLIGEGKLVNEVKEKVKRLGLCNNVIFLGAVNDAFKFYNAMDYFVLPSRYEGLPVVGVEAQVSGLPCYFSSEVTPEAKLLRTTNYISISDSPSKWASIITDICEQTDRMIGLTEMKNTDFDINKAASKLEEFYEKLLRKI